MVEINPDAPSKSRVRTPGIRERRALQKEEPPTSQSSGKLKTAGMVATFLEGFNSLRHLFSSGSTWGRFFTHAAITTVLGYFSFKSYGSGGTQQ